MNKLIKSIYESQLPQLEKGSSDNVYIHIISEAIQLSESDYGDISFYKKGILEKMYASLDVLYDTNPKTKKYALKTIKSQKPQLIKTSSITSDFPHLKAYGVRFIFQIPLIYNNKVVGMISLYSRKNHTSPRKILNRLVLFAAFATLSVMKAQLYLKLDQAVSSRNLFIATAIHEIRTPLTSINGFIEILQKNPFQKDSDEIIHGLYRESLRLRKVLEKLDELNKIRMKNVDYDFRYQSLENILLESVKIFQIFYPDYKLSVESQTNKTASCIADFGKLSLVFFNILENAAKYSDKKSTGSIRLKSDNKHIDIMFENRGTKISSEKIQSSLNGHGRSEGNPEEGLGIGLFLTKNIIERHRGRIEINSEADDATRVNIRLPIHNLSS